MKSIPGYEGLYSAEEDGRIWSHYVNRYLSATLNKDGYYITNLSKDNNLKTYFTHRLIALTFIPNPKNKPTVDHIKNKEITNNNINNLRWATYAENRHNTSVQQNNKLGHKHICMVVNKQYNSFKVTMERYKIVHTKNFKTLEDAIKYRDDYLAGLGLGGKIDLVSG